MASLPALENWECTRDALHQVALVQSAIKVCCVEPQPNSLQYSLNLSPTGLCASQLNIGGELAFDIAGLRLVYSRAGRVEFELEVARHDQQSLFDEVVKAFAALGVEISPSRTHIRHNRRFDINRDLAADYLLLLDVAYGALARFRARLNGYSSSLALWAHHFDLGFLFFPVNTVAAMDEHRDAHLAFGFAPNSPGLDRPYFYAYGWSPSGGYVTIPAAWPARLETQNYTGLYAAYDNFDQSQRLDSQVEEIFCDFFQLAIAEL